MAHTIERSPGIAVYGYIVGGGYTGATDELDEEVLVAAKMLAKTYNRDIEIRFNSDRRSGGAWVKDGKPGFDGNCQVGLCAGLKSKDMVPPKARGQGIYTSTYIAQANLKDSSVANQGNPDRRYAYHYHDCLLDGLRWLDDNVAGLDA